jgi:hypothetical protein
MSQQIFVSHTKMDMEFCDAFDRACAGVEIERYRSEFEDIEGEMIRTGLPAWSPIKENIEKSKALFLLVGRELNKGQDKGGLSWEHTQNWIAFEIGVACAKGIDVWVVCDDKIQINFPVPYLNNYLPSSPRNRLVLKHLENVLRGYEKGLTCGLNPNLKTDCPFCKASFNLRVTLQPNKLITCPQCLKEIKYPDGFGYII